MGFQRLVAEIASLQNNIDHIKEIVTMQQTYATMVGVVEVVEVVAAPPVAPVPTGTADRLLRFNRSASEAISVMSS